MSQVRTLMSLETPTQGRLNAVQHRPAQAPVLTRRQLGLGMLSGLAAAAAALQAAPQAAAAELTPYERGFQLEYGLTSAGKMRSCPSDANPNCVSSASLNECYSPAWESGEPDVTRAIQQFEAALLEVCPDAVEVGRQSAPGSEYRNYRVGSTLFGHDNVEVLIAEREEGEAPLVTYRSMAGSVKYIWPITQPITDFDAQRKRMKAVRQQLGWRIPGCDLLECYLE